MNKNLTWAGIQMLLGGVAMAAKNVLKTDPEYILSWKGCFKNEKPYLENNPHLKDKYYLIDDADNKFEPYYVDIVCGVPVCSALSSLNSKSSADYKSVQNMYEMADIVLSKIKPKVYIFENAPHLYTNKGNAVRDKLIEFGEKFGYKSSIVATDTFLHGVPQKRKRTFWFFWNESVPELEYENLESKMLDQYLKEIPLSATHQDVNAANKKLTDNIHYKFLFKIFGKKYRQEMQRLGCKTIYGLYRHNPTDEMKVLQKEYEKFVYENGTANEIRKLEHVLNKHSQGLGAWDDSPIFYTTYSNAMVGRNLYGSVHPIEDRFFNIRECMHLMGLPHDFNLSDKNWNIICQNVPVNTASFWIGQCKKYCENKLQLTDYNFIMQSNEKQRVDYPKQTKPLIDKNTTSLEMYL